jgi:hypothetical protein
VLARLAEGDTTVSDLAAPFAMTLPALTKHLTLLENADLIARTKAGRTVTCRLQAAGLKAAAEWMEFYERFWPEQFDALAVFLDDKSSVTGRYRIAILDQQLAYQDYLVGNGTPCRHGNCRSRPWQPRWPRSTDEVRVRPRAEPMLRRNTNFSR